MSDSIFEQDDDQQDETPMTPKALRDHAKRVAEENKALQERLAKLEQRERTRAVEDLLPTGVNKKVAQLYQGEPEGFTQWYEAYKDAFGGSTEQQTQSAPQVDESDDTDEVDPAWRQSMQRITEGETGTQDATASAGDLAKLEAFMKQYGNDAYSGLQNFGSAFQ